MRLPTSRCGLPMTIPSHPHVMLCARFGWTAKRQITEKGLNFIKLLEGFSETVYLCPAGYPTIGHGHVVLDHEAEAFIDAITKEPTSKLLKQDANIAEQPVKQFIPVSLTDGQFDALKRRFLPKLAARFEKTFQNEEGSVVPFSLSLPTLR